MWEKASPLLGYQPANESLLAKVSLSVESEKIKFHIPFHLKSLKKHCGERGVLKECSEFLKMVVELSAHLENALFTWTFLSPE